MATVVQSVSLTGKRRYQLWDGGDFIDEYTNRAVALAVAKERNCEHDPSFAVIPYKEDELLWSDRHKSLVRYKRRDETGMVWLVSYDNTALLDEPAKPCEVRRPSQPST